MSIRIGSNIASLQAQRGLAEATDLVSESSERLSSGLRINRASDDAAGLSIASSLAADTRIYSQAIRNVNDGISVLNVAEGAVHELSGIVNRQNELAEESANGVYSLQQRRALDREAQALTSEFNRIIQTTSFDGLKLLDGTELGGLTIQAGTGARTTLTISLGDGLARTVGDGTFKGPTSYAGNNGSSVAVADFNGDGIPDIAQNSGTTATFLFGNGDGSFKAAATIAFAGPSAEFDLASGDLRRLGRQDLVSASGGYLSVALANGDGSYNAPLDLTIPGNTNGVAVVDLNGDGKPDVVAPDSTSNVLDVFIGNGDGSFKSVVSYSGFQAPYSIGIADLNGDGIPDVFAPSGPGNSYLTVALGNGDGSLRVPQSFSVPNGSFQAVATDLNHDGMLDLITQGYYSGNISVVRGNGDGTFSAPTTYVADTNTYGLATGDFNGDGVPDIVGAGYANGDVSVLMGNADGSLSHPSTFAAGTHPVSVTVADLNGDGVDDLVIGLESGPVQVLVGNSTWSTSEAGVNLLSADSARRALATLAQTQTRLSTELGNIGVMRSRFEATLNNLTSLRENETAAMSQIMDVDVAEETATMVRATILQKVGASVLSHANQDPSLALKLLRIE